MIFLDRSQLHALRETLALALGQRKRFRVTGQSMKPTLAADEYVLVDPKRSPLPGDLVVAEHPAKNITVIKRVAAITAKGALELASDNPEAGSDSRAWGPVAATNVIGTVTIVLNRPNALQPSASRPLPPTC